MCELLLLMTFELHNYMNYSFFLIGPLQTSFLLYKYRFEGVSFHTEIFYYANTSMQYTAIFHGCKNVNFQMKNYNTFLAFH